MVRGILATVYGRLRDPGLTADDCMTVLDTVYRDKPHIIVLPVGIYPSTKWVRYTNKIIISVLKRLQIIGKTLEHLMIFYMQMQK